MTAHTVTIIAAPLLDTLVRCIAWALSKVSRVGGAGAFWMDGAVSFWSAWHEPSERGGSWTLRLGLLEVVVDVGNGETATRCELPEAPAPTLTAWESAASWAAWMLDGAARVVAWVAGYIVASRKGYSAGVFYWSDQQGWWEAWCEPGSFNVRMGRLELNVDLPR